MNKNIYIIITKIIENPFSIKNYEDALIYYKDKEDISTAIKDLINEYFMSNTNV